MLVFASLTPTYTGSELPLTMYQGHFIAPGYLKVYFGYRLSDGTLVVNGEPIAVEIME